MIYFLIGMNAFTFLLFGLDKQYAKHNHWRIREKFLFLTAFLYGSAGALAGMYCFHHKTRKWSFRILIPLFFMIQLASLYVLAKIR